MKQEFYAEQENPRRPPFFIDRMLNAARNPHVANDWSLGLSDIYNRLFKDWADREESDSKEGPK